MNTHFSRIQHQKIGFREAELVVFTALTPIINWIRQYTAEVFIDEIIKMYQQILYYIEHNLHQYGNIIQ